MKLRTDVWIKLMAYLKKKFDADMVVYKARVSKDLDITYSYVVKILFLLEKKGFIYFLKQGRNIYVLLTPQGQKLSEHCEKVNKAIK